MSSDRTVITLGEKSSSLSEDTICDLTETDIKSLNSLSLSPNVSEEKLKELYSSYQPKNSTQKLLLREDLSAEMINWLVTNLRIDGAYRIDHLYYLNNITDKQRFDLLSFEYANREQLNPYSFRPIINIHPTHADLKFFLDKLTDEAVRSPSVILESSFVSYLRELLSNPALHESSITQFFDKDILKMSEDITLMKDLIISRFNNPTSQIFLYEYFYRKYKKHRKLDEIKEHLITYREPKECPLLARCLELSVDPEDYNSQTLRSLMVKSKKYPVYQLILKFVAHQELLLFPSGRGREKAYSDREETFVEVCKEYLETYLDIDASRLPGDYVIRIAETNFSLTLDLITNFPTEEEMMYSKSLYEEGYNEQ